MNDEDKRVLMVGFIIPFVCLMALYFGVATLLCCYVYHLPDPSFMTMLKYAAAKYNGWLGLGLDDYYFACPEEFAQDIYDHIQMKEVMIPVYPKSVDMFVKPPIYRWFPFFLILSLVISLICLFRKSSSRDDKKAWQKKQSMQRYIRGAKLVSEEKLVGDSHRLVTDPVTYLPTKSGKLFISDSRCKGHIFLLGTTGTGKSVTLANLIGGILEKHPEVKVIYADRKGEFFSRFGRKGKDILFNPFDARTVGWSLFNEIRFDKQNAGKSMPPDLIMMAKILFPTEGKKETIWDNAAARIFMSAVCYCLLDQKATMQDFYVFNQQPLTDIAAAFRTLPKGLSTGYGVVQDSSSKAAASAMLTYTTVMEDLSCLNQIDGDWSIVDWIHGRGSTANLYLSSAGRNDKAFVRLITLLIDFAGREVQQFEDNGGQNLRLLFVFDELAALPKLSTLSYLLSQARSKGVGCILATQSFEKIKAIYGDKEAHEIFANTKTKFIYSMPDPADSEYLSKAVGSVEVFRREKSESRSTAGMLGKGDDRHGRNENTRVTEERLFLPSQIANQKTGQVVVQFPDFEGEVAQIQLLKDDRYQAHQPAFEEREQELVYARELPSLLKDISGHSQDEKKKEQTIEAEAHNTSEDDLDDDDVIY